MDHDPLFDLGVGEGVQRAETPRPPRIGPKRLRHAVRNQVEFQECSLDELLPEEHETRIVWEYVCGLDLSELLQRIQAVEGGPGQAPADPRILVALWLYATLRGVGSARELNRLCQYHAAYRWICGGVSMNYHTLADFRTQHVELLDRLLTESVASLMAEGLVTLDRVAQDGMKVRASAGAASFRRQPTLEEALVEAENQVAKLRKELEANSGGQQDPPTSGPEARGRRTSGADSRRVGAVAEDRREQEGQRPREGPCLDDGCRRPRDEDGRWRFSSGVQRATGDGHRFAGHHGPGRDELRRRPRTIGADGGTAPAAVRSEVPREALVDGGFVKKEDIEQVEPSSRRHDGLRSGAWSRKIRAAIRTPPATTTLRRWPSGDSGWPPTRRRPSTANGRRRPNA